MEKQLIHSRLLAIMKEVGTIGKDRKNESQNYKFRGIDDVMNELHERFSTHGVFILTDIIDQRHEERPTKSGGLNIYRINTYKFTFMAEDGSHVVSTQIGEGMDNGDKASNKAASVALKYALMFMFLIPTNDQKDPENDSHDLKAEKPTTKASQPAQQAAKPKAPVKSLIPGATDGSWNKVIDRMKGIGKMATDWPKIKENYLITPEHEKQLFSEMGWEYKS